MSQFLPSAPPKASRDLVLKIAHEDFLKAGYRLDQLPKCFFLAVRGYRRDTMGVPGRNDLGIVDDAMFWVSPAGVKAINANTDPSRAGWNPGVGKPYALLKPGVHWFRRGPHKGKTPAFRQCTDEEARKLGIPNDGEFAVTRMWGHNDPRNYDETGYFAINIHPMGEETTSSWGCQTVHPSDRNFLKLAWDQSIAYAVDAIPYILHDGPIC